MKNQLITRLAWGILCFLFLGAELHASHAMGGEVTSRCLGGNTYEFTVNFYRDCAGTSAPGSVTLQLNSTVCGANASVTLSLVGAGTEVSPLCPAQLAQSTCQGGALPGVEQYVYQGTYTFTQNCPDWNVSYTHCCRNNLITNLLNAPSNDIFIFTTVDNTGGMCNSSPTFTALPVPYICDGQLFCYNHGAVDPDGDSLVYSLVNALTGPYPGGLIAYNAPYSPTYPITDLSGSISFDPATGSMCVTPNGPQVSVVTIQVDEYRNGVLIGSTLRDLQIIVQSCTNQQPSQAVGGLTNLSPAPVQLDSNSVEVCPGDLVSFDLVFNDANASDNITLLTNLATAIPGATFTTSGLNPITGSFSWTPSALDVGFHSFVVTVQDDGCPVLGSQVFSYDIRVLEGTYAGPDLFYCPAGGPVQILVAGGTTFSWNTLSGDAAGLSCFNCPNPQASPSVTSVYEVVSDLSATCKNRDTIVVNLVPDFTLDPGLDTSICKYGSAPLNATASPALYAPYAFVWTPGGSLNNPAIPNPIADPITTTTYYLTATSNAGCTIRDSVTVTVSGVAPFVSIAPIDTICDGDSILLDGFVTFECDTTTYPCTGAPTTVQTGTLGSATTIYGPAYLSTVTPYTIRRQFIYTAAELNALGFTAGKISEIAMEFQTAGDPVANLSVRMGCTAQSEWAVSPYSFINGLTEVKQSHTLTPVVGWTTIPLDFDYYWDGVSNLVVEMCTDAATLGLGSSVYYNCSNPVQYNCLYYNLANANGACAQATGTRTSCRPHMQFTFCDASPAVTVSWSPGVGLDNPNILDPLFVGPGSQQYTLSAADGSCVGTDIIEVTVAPGFVADIGNDTTLCRNVPYVFNPNLPAGFGPYTFNWAPAQELDCVNCPAPTATPGLSTTFYADIRSAAGCTIRDSMRISLSGVAPNVVGGPNDTICPQDAATLAPIVNLGCGPVVAACTGPSNSGTVGTGISSSATYGPHSTSTLTPYSNRKQYIFTKDELDAMGFAGGGKITAVGLEYVSANSIMRGIVIKMGCTNVDQYTLGTDTFLTDLYVVKNSFDHTPTAGVNTFVFDNEFSWDGLSNLVLEFCVDSAQTGTSSTVMYGCLSPVAYRTLYRDLTNTGGACSYLTGFRTSCRPNVSFTFCQALPSVTYNWSPAATLDDPSLANPQATPAVTTTYEVIVDGGNGCQNRDFVTVVIDSSVYVTGVASTHSPCVGATVNLNTTMTGSPMPTALPGCGVNGTPCSQPTNTHTVGNGTFNSVSYSPFYGNYTDVRMQYLIRAQDLIASGVPSGTISEIAWYISSKMSVGDFRNMTISMGCTNDNGLSTATGWLPTQVVYGPQNTATSGVGWNTFGISGFDWDGNSNIVVEVCFNQNNNNIIGGDQVRYATGLSYVGTMRNYTSANGSNGCTLAPLYTSTTIPDFQFTVCPPPPTPFTYTWTPPTGLNDPTVPNPTLASFPGDTVVYTVTVTGGRCTVVDTVTLIECGPLPADALILYGERTAEGVRLDWETSNESGTSHFVVERMDREGVFRGLGEVVAGGFTAGETWYQMDDLQPWMGDNTYRIRQVDQNGGQQFSNAVQVRFGAGATLLAVYPNPVGGSQLLQAEYFAPTDGSLQLQWMDALGQLVRREDRMVSPGTNLLDLSVRELPAGAYFLRVEGFGTVETVKVVVLE